VIYLFQVNDILSFHQSQFCSTPFLHFAVTLQNEIQQTKYENIT